LLIFTSQEEAVQSSTPSELGVIIFLVSYANPNYYFSSFILSLLALEIYTTWFNPPSNHYMAAIYWFLGYTTTTQWAFYSVHAIFIRVFQYHFDCHEPL
jgi:hypothetical protein